MSRRITWPRSSLNEISVKGTAKSCERTERFSLDPGVVEPDQIPDRQVVVAVRFETVDERDADADFARKVRNRRFDGAIRAGTFAGCQRHER